MIGSAISQKPRAPTRVKLPLSTTKACYFCTSEWSNQGAVPLCRTDVLRSGKTAMPPLPGGATSLPAGAGAGFGPPGARGLREGRVFSDSAVAGVGVGAGPADAWAGDGHPGQGNGNAVAAGGAGADTIPPSVSATRELLRRRGGRSALVTGGANTGHGTQRCSKHEKKHQLPGPCCCRV